MPTNHKIIFFDAAGTLLHLPRGVGAHYREVALRHGVDISAQAFEAAFRSAWKAAVPPATTGLPRPDDDKEWWRALVTSVLRQCGGQPTTSVSELFEDLYSEFTKPGVWELYPEVMEVLASLRARYRLGIISNFDGRLRTVLGHLGLTSMFDMIVISSEVGADKPDPYIYRRACEMAGVQPSEAFHVGDDLVCDWQGAREAGLVSLELKRPKSDLRSVLEDLAT